MRLWHKDLIYVLPRQQLLGQWRECCLIAKNIAEKGTPKSKHSPANQHYKTNPKTNKQARATKRAIVLKWLRDPKQAVNCAEIMRQLWNPSPQDEDTKRGEFYKKRDGAINKQSGARYSFTDEEINQLYRIKSNRS